MKTSRRSFASRLTAAILATPILGSALTGTTSASRPQAGSLVMADGLSRDEIYRRVLGGNLVIYRGHLLRWTGWKAALNCDYLGGQWIAYAFKPGPNGWRPAKNEKGYWVGSCRYLWVSPCPGPVGRYLLYDDFDTTPQEDQLMVYSRDMENRPHLERACRRAFDNLMNREDIWDDAPA